MTELSFENLQDLALLAHYHLYKQGFYDQKNKFMEKEFSLVDATEFETNKSLEALKQRRFLRVPKSGLPVITGAGISRVERELGRKKSFLASVRERVVFQSHSHDRPVLTFEALTDDTEDLVFSIPPLAYRVEWYEPQSTQRTQRISQREKIHSSRRLEKTEGIS